MVVLISCTWLLSIQTTQLSPFLHIHNQGEIVWTCCDWEILVSPPQLNVLPLSYDAPYYYYCKTLWCSLKMSRSRYCYASIEIFVLVALSLFYWILLILHSEYWKSFISDILYFFLDKLLEPIGEGCIIQRKISGPKTFLFAYYHHYWVKIVTLFGISMYKIMQ